MSSRSDVQIGDWLTTERASDGRYPFSRWYLRPLARQLAIAISGTWVRPLYFTLLGGACAIFAALLLIANPSLHIVAGILVLGAWFCDRADGVLARKQQVSSPLGAWLDANIDELSDVGLHLATALAAYQLTASWIPVSCLVAFLAGKYLFMYGLAVEASPQAARNHPPKTTGWLGTIYHGPANADVRIHLLILALLSGQLTAELVLVALYYNFRWIVRYALVARRFTGATS